jgi:hypothetical protein
LTVGALTVQAAADEVQRASTALHRKFTGNAASAPSSLPAALVRIERVHPRLGAVDVKAGDLLLAVELSAGEGNDALQRFTSVDEVQRLFNDMQLGSYEGRPFRCWLCRDGDVRVTEIVAKRLLW